MIGMLINEIQVAYVGQRSDFEIETDVEARLANDVPVDDFLITVDESDSATSFPAGTGPRHQTSAARNPGHAWTAQVAGGREGASSRARGGTFVWPVRGSLG